MKKFQPRPFAVAVFFIMAFMIYPRLTHANPPESINLQAVLNNGSIGFQDGVYDVQVRFLDGYSEVYSQIITDVSVSAGVFSVDIRSTPQQSLAEVLKQHPNAKLQIGIDGRWLPPQAMTSVPFSLNTTNTGRAGEGSRMGDAAPSGWTLTTEVADYNPTTAPIAWMSISSKPADCGANQFFTGFDSSNGTVKCAPAASTTGGDITGLTAGLGLSGGADTGRASLQTDFKSVQARVSSPCDEGKGIRAIDIQGIAACDQVGSVKSITTLSGISRSSTDGGIALSIDNNYIETALGACENKQGFRPYPAFGGVRYSSTYKSIIIVSPVSDDPLLNGPKLTESLDRITDASVSNRYLLLLEPGVYDIQPQSLSMKPFVDVSGSGSGITTIRSGNSNTTSISTIIAASNAELRDLSLSGTKYTSIVVPPQTANFSASRLHIDHQLGGADIIIIQTQERVTLQNIDIVAFGMPRGIYSNEGAYVDIDGFSFVGTGGRGGVCSAIWAEGGTIQLVDGALDLQCLDYNFAIRLIGANLEGDRVKIQTPVPYRPDDRMPVGGIYASNSSVSLRNSDLRTARYMYSAAINAEGTGTLDIIGSRIGSEETLSFGTSIYSNVSGGTTIQNSIVRGATSASPLRAFNTMFDGTVTAGATVKCANCYNASFNARNASCQ